MNSPLYGPSAETAALRDETWFQAAVWGAMAGAFAVWFWYNWKHPG